MNKTEAMKRLDVIEKEASATIGAFEFFLDKRREYEKK